MRLGLPLDFQLPARLATHMPVRVPAWKSRRVGVGLVARLYMARKRSVKPKVEITKKPKAYKYSWERSRCAATENAISFGCEYGIVPPRGVLKRGRWSFIVHHCCADIRLIENVGNRRISATLDTEH